MIDALKALALSKKYTSDTIQGAGAVAGKPCQIQSIVDNGDGTHTITFLWEDNAGTNHTQTLTLKDGEDGANGTNGETPAMSVEAITGGHKVTFQTTGGQISYDVMDGADGAKGDKGDNGADGAKGDKGDKGDDGSDGFSPTITVKTSTDAAYILTITTKDGSFDTPNLKGQGGGGGGTGTVNFVNGKTPDATGNVEINKADISLGNVDNTSDADKPISTAQAAKNTDFEDRITELENNPVNPFQFSTMPEATEHTQEVIQYIGADTATYKRGFFYRSTPIVESGDLTYVWQQTNTQPSNTDYADMTNKPQINGVEISGDKSGADFDLQETVQFAVLPDADATTLGKIYQYTGATTADYKSGYFYQCRYNTESTSYDWVKVDVSDNSTLSSAVATLQTNQGDLSTLEVGGVVDLVGAINKLNAKDVDRFDYIEPNLIIYYKDGTTKQLSVGDILAETQIGELQNVVDDTIADGNILQYDSAIKRYKPYAILTALSQLLTDSKDYTDEKIASAIVAGAYVCDEKPSYDAENDTVIYKQENVVKTTTQTDARFYYYTDGDPFCTSWIDDIEFTFSVSDVNFQDYVNKNSDVTSTYAEDLTDKSKIPNVAALDTLLTIIKTSLAEKVNTADVIDVLTSSDATKPLSAKQGKALNDKTNTKQDIMQYSELPVADAPYLGKVAQYVGTTGAAYTKGYFYQCKYDSWNEVYYWEIIKYAADTDNELSDLSTNPVQNKVVKAAVDAKQNSTLSAPITVNGTEYATVETAIAAILALANLKQPSTLSTPIEVDGVQKTTVETALSALAAKSVGVDGTTIVKNASTGELSAVKATSNSVGVVKPDGDTITIDADGTIHSTSAEPYDDTAITGRVSEIEGVIPNTASASNQLVTATQLSEVEDAIPDVSGKQNKNLSTAIGSATTVEAALSAHEAKFSTIPLNQFQVGSGGAIGYADLGSTTSTISQAFSWLEVEYGRVDGFIDKYFITVAGASSNSNYFKVVRLTNYGQTPTITVDANKHIWMSMDTYVYIRVKAYGNFSISGELSRTAPTGTVMPINRLVTESDLTSSVTSGSTAPITSGGVYNYSYKRKMVQWNGAGNRYTKLGNLYATSAGLMTTVYIITCRNGETWLMYCGNSDGAVKTNPVFHRLIVGTGKLFYFAWDSSTNEVEIGTQGYNGIQVTQIAGEPRDFTISDISSSNLLDNPTEISYKDIINSSSYVVHGGVSPTGDTSVTVDVSSFCTDALSRSWEAQNKNTIAFSGACLYAYPASDTTVTMVMSRAASAAAFELYGSKRPT